MSTGASEQTLPYERLTEQQFDILFCPVPRW